jgi:hypothetical protein
MTKKRAAAELRAMKDAVEIALHKWIEAGEDLEILMDKRDQFSKRYKKLLKKSRIKKYAESPLL